MGRNCHGLNLLNILEIVNKINGMSQDIIEKRAQYITRNNELLQEFSFAHPTTKCLINNVFNTHFSGTYLITPQENLKTRGMSRKD